MRVLFLAIFALTLMMGYAKAQSYKRCVAWGADKYVPAHKDPRTGQHVTADRLPGKCTRWEIVTDRNDRREAERDMRLNKMIEREQERAERRR